MTRKRLVRIFAEESGFPLLMADEIIGRILTDARQPVILKRFKKKLDHHPTFGKARVWAWVAPGNVPDPIALAVIAARIQQSELVLKLSRQNELTGRALVAALKKPGQKIRVAVNPSDFKKYSTHAEAWIVYGADATIQALHRHAPIGAGRVDHGHRTSISIVFRSAIKHGLATAVKNCAHDIWLYDQRGCLSPRIVWVEGEAGPFAAALQEELFRLHQKYGAIGRTPEQKRMRRSVLEELRIRALNQNDLVLTSPPRTTSGGERLGGGFEPVVYLLKKGRFTTPASGQIIAVKSFNNIGDVVKGIQPFFNHLQGIAVAGDPSESRRVKKTFASSTARYFPPIGLLQNPPLDWQS